MPINTGCICFTVSVAFYLENTMLKKITKSVLMSVVLSAPMQVAHASTITYTPYIVTLRDGVVTQDFVNREIHLGVDVIRQFTLATSGFLADLTANEYLKLKNDPRVEHIEPDSIVGLSAEQSLQNDSGWRPSWGLDRINQVDGVLDDFYSYEYVGNGVDVYVLDTGINSSHTEFTSRIKTGYSAIDDPNGTEDCNGHGSHVSGVVGGTIYGVAKSVNIIPVRVLGCAATGTTSSVLSGINWMIANHQAGVPAVANMSFATGKSTILNEAVISAIDDGITVVVAAGNTNSDSCNYSPASETLAITVAAITIENTKASYSNHGSCVDLFAPGSDIVSAFYGSPTILRSRSGTSMATPHVSGVVAQILEQHPDWTPQQVSTQIISQSTANALSLTVENTVNLLLFNNSPHVIAEEETTTTTTVAPTTTTIAPVTTTTTTVPVTTTTIPVTTTTVPVTTTTSTTSTTTTTLAPVSVTTSTTVYLLLETTTTSTTLAPATTTTTIAPTTTIRTTTTSSSTSVPPNQQEEEKEEQTPVTVKQPSITPSKTVQAPSETSTTSTTTTIPQMTTTTTIQANVQILSVPSSCKIVRQIKTFNGIKYVCTKNGKTTKWLAVKKTTQPYGNKKP